jgi:hypothetical protein
MYRIIRVGSGFTPIVVVTPPGAEFDNPESKYYLWSVGDSFKRISTEEAWRSFSGQADGWGYEAPPEELFPSLDAVKDWALPKVREWWEQMKKHLEEKPDPKT